jgi:hypothetical protein
MSPRPTARNYTASTREEEGRGYAASGASMVRYQGSGIVVSIVACVLDQPSSRARARLARPRTLYALLRACRDLAGTPPERLLLQWPRHRWANLGGSLCDLRPHDGSKTTCNPVRHRRRWSYLHISRYGLCIRNGAGAPTNASGSRRSSVRSVSFGRRTRFYGKRQLFRGGGARPPVQEVIGFLEAHVYEFGVEPMCRVLHIAPSTWHEHARRKADPDRLPERAKRDAELSVHIRRIFAENFSVYGVKDYVRLVAVLGQ